MPKSFSTQSTRLAASPPRKQNPAKKTSKQPAASVEPGSHSQTSVEAGLAKSVESDDETNLDDTRADSSVDYKKELGESLVMLQRLAR
jgi:hypothetical protein